MLLLKYKKTMLQAFFAMLVVFLPFITFYFTQFFILNNGYRAVVSWIIANPMTFLANYIVLAAFLVLFSGLIGSMTGGTVIYSVLAVVIIFANVQKTTIQNTPVLPWDLYKINEAIWAIQFMYSKTVYVLTLIFIAAAILGFLAFLFFRFRRNLRRPKKHGAQALRFLAVSAALFTLTSLFYFWQSPAKSFINKSSKGVYLWDQVSTCKNNGLYLSFLLNRQYMAVDKASGYGEQSIKALNRNLSLKAPDKKPTVIMIMSESFWDLTNAPDLTFSKDPIPNIHKLKDEGKSFYMASSEVGGGTCNVEFEALTGLTNAYLPAGSMAYVEYINKKVPALPWYFKDLGYKTTAIHPYLKSFWNRDKVYPNLGFDNFYSKDDMKGAQTKGAGGFISDHALSQRIIEQYEQGGTQQFIFAVSMQNHFPYWENYYKENTIDVNGSNLSPDLRGILRCYSQGIHDADAGLGELIDYFSKVDQPVNIIFYGDHFPSLEGYSRNRLNGNGVPPAIDRTSPMFQSITNKFTPVAFWSNYGAKVPECEGKEYSALSYSVLDFAGLPLNSYFSLIKEGFSAMPVLQKNLVIDSAGKISEKVPDNLAADYKLLNILNYDALFGKRYLFDYLWKN